MKLRCNIPFSACLATCFSILSVVTVAAHAAQTIEYTPDSSIFANPERGFHNRYDFVPGGEVDFSRSSYSGNTLVHSYIRLDEYRNQAIPTVVLEQLSASLRAARNQGKKAILRVAYNFGPYPDSLPDASEHWIQYHVSQLAPVFKTYKDIIAYLEAGFIGAWGEWHTSTNGHDTNVAAKNRIIETILNGVPNSIPVAMRYPTDIRAAIASGIDATRLGSHQDCFLASSPTDMGTWGRDSQYSVEEDKALVSQIGQHSPVGGETCYVSSPRVNCETAMSELKSMHFSDMNEDFDQDVLNVLRNEGCFDDIDRKLGYRFELVEASIDNQVAPGSTMDVSFDIQNSGFAVPFKSRPVYLVLHSNSQPDLRHVYGVSTDIKSWAPDAITHIEASLEVPSSFAAGTYSLSLWMPDAADALKDDARYSIRLANQDVWNETSGMNLLLNYIDVDPIYAVADQPISDSEVSDEAVSIVLEAESGILQGGARSASCASCSNDHKVGYIGQGLGQLQLDEFNISAAGQYNLTINYLSAEPRSLSLLINNELYDLQLPASGGWDLVSTYTLPVNLNAGVQTLVLSQQQGWAPDIDKFVIESEAVSADTNAAKGLVLDNFDDSQQWPGTNDLNRWAGANGFTNTAGQVNENGLYLQYHSDGWFGTDVMQDISDKTYLVLMIQGDQGGEEHHFHLQFGGIEGVLADLTQDSITTSSQEIKLNLKELGVDLQNPGQLQMTFWWGYSSGITIREMRFE